MADQDLRELFETAVCEHMAESGVLEGEVQKECLVRCGEEYQDPIINSCWNYFHLGALLAPKDPKLRTRIDDEGWYCLYGWVDPPEPRDGFELEVKTEPLTGAVIAYRFNQVEGARHE